MQHRHSSELLVDKPHEILFGHLFVVFVSSIKQLRGKPRSTHKDSTPKKTTKVAVSTKNHGRGESEPYPGATQRFATDTVEVWFHGHHSTIGWRFKGDTDTFTSEPLEGYYFIDVFPSEYIFVNQFTALEIQWNPAELEPSWFVLENFGPF